MAAIVPIALAAWVVACVALFWKLPARDAALVALVGGWAFLPVERFPAEVVDRSVNDGGSVHAVVIPTPRLVNKATAVGLGCLAGAVLFGRPALGRLRPSWVDLPVAAWCLVPLASAAANGLAPAEGLAQVRYLFLAWGVPYLMGRAYLGDGEALGRLGLGLVAAGLLYVPVCLIEMVIGPSVYALAYGPHPYQSEGMERLVGYRPLGFQEHGNQLGMWTASAAVSAVWLWRSGRLREMAGVPGGAVAAALVAVCVACQSLIAIVVMGLGAAGSWAGGRATTGRPSPVRVGWVGAALACAALALGTAAAARAARDPGARARFRGVFVSAGKSSFTWRLARTEEFLPVVARRPALGRGRADWSDAPDGRFVNPVNVGLWLLAAGMYGAVGSAALYAALGAPALTALRRLGRASWLTPSGSAVALVAILLAINLVDSLMNSTWLLPLTAGAGGLNAWSLRKAHGERAARAG